MLLVLLLHTIPQLCITNWQKWMLMFAACGTGANVKKGGWNLNAAAHVGSTPSCPSSLPPVRGIFGKVRFNQCWPSFKCTIHISKIRYINHSLPSFKNMFQINSLHPPHTHKHLKTDCSWPAYMCWIAAEEITSCTTDAMNSADRSFWLDLIVSGLQYGILSLETRQHRHRNTLHDHTVRPL